MRWMVILSIVMPTVALLSACTHNTRVISSQQPPPASISFVNAPLQVLVIDDVRIIQDGQEGNVDPGFVQRVAFEMRRSGLFRAVYDPANAHAAPEDAVRMQLYVTETLDRQWGEKVGKDIIVGMSYLALMPIMPYQMDYSVSARAVVTIAGQNTREFESFSQSEVEYKGFSDSRAAEEDLKRTAMNDCLQGLLAKMKSDGELLSVLDLH
jgi:hypothetical protein